MLLAEDSLSGGGHRDCLDLQSYSRIGGHPVYFHCGAGRQMAVEEFALDAVDSVLILGQVGHKAGERDHMRGLATRGFEHLAQVAVGYCSLSGSIAGDRIEVFRPMRVLMIDRRAGHARDEYQFARLNLDRGHEQRVDGGIVAFVMDCVEVACAARRRWFMRGLTRRFARWFSRALKGLLRIFWMVACHQLASCSPCVRSFRGGPWL